METARQSQLKLAVVAEPKTCFGETLMASGD